MACNAGPDIIEDGLVLCLDAANINSYPKSGTTWSDLSANGNNVTLTNGVAFNEGNVGNMVFDGSNDYIDFYAPNLSSTTTVEMYANLPSFSSHSKMMFGWLRYDIWCKNGRLGYNTASSDLHGISSATVSALGLVGNWKHYVFEMRSDVSYVNNKIYIDTKLQSLSQQQGSQNNGNRNFNSGNGRIACWKDDLNYLMAIKLSYFRVYNRALTADEVRQNYEATVGRFT